MAKYGLAEAATQLSRIAWRRSKVLSTHDCDTEWQRREDLTRRTGLLRLYVRPWLKLSGLGLVLILARPPVLHD
jgi:hypothetical protein